MQPVEEAFFEKAAQCQVFGQRYDLPRRTEAWIANGFRRKRIAHSAQFLVRNVHLSQKLDLGIDRLAILRCECFAILLEFENAPRGLRPCTGFEEIKMRVGEIACTTLEVDQRGLQ